MLKTIPPRWSRLRCLLRRRLATTGHQDRTWRDHEESGHRPSVANAEARFVKKMHHHRHHAHKHVVTVKKKSGTVLVPRIEVLPSEAANSMKSFKSKSGTKVEARRVPLNSEVRIRASRKPVPTSDVTLERIFPRRYATPPHRSGSSEKDPPVIIVRAMTAGRARRGASGR